MHVQLVFVTKYWHPVFTARHLERMEQIMRNVCAIFRAELAEFSGEAEHVHLLVKCPPTVAISRLVNSPKACPPAGCGKSSPACAATTGRPNARGSGRTSPGPSAEPHLRPAPLH
jgi:putative transposase